MKDRLTILAIIVILIIASVIFYYPKDSEDEGGCHHTFVEGRPIVTHVVLTIDSEDNVHIAWQDDGNAGAPDYMEEHSYYIRFDNQGNNLINETYFGRRTTGDEEILDRSFVSSLILDSDGNPHLFFSNQWCTIGQNGTITRNESTETYPTSWNDYQIILLASGDIGALWQNRTDNSNYMYSIYNVSTGHVSTTNVIQEYDAVHIPNRTYEVQGPRFIFEDEENYIHSYWHTWMAGWTLGIVTTNFTSNGTNWSKEFRLVNRWGNETEPRWIVGDRLSNGTVVLLFNEYNHLTETTLYRMMYLWPNGGYQIIDIFNDTGFDSWISPMDMRMIHDSSDRLHILFVESEDFFPENSLHNTLYYAQYSKTGDMLIPIRAVGNLSWTINFDVAIDSNGDLNIVWGAYYFKINDEGIPISLMKYYINHTTTREEGWYPDLES